MSYEDGGSEDINRPTVTIVSFGSIDSDLGPYLAGSVNDFLRSLSSDLACQPGMLLFKRRVPAGVPPSNQGDFFLSRMHQFSGNIVLGITDEGFYDPNLPRYVFGYGNGGRGVLSTWRFRRETGSQRLLFERLGKEIIKILALACDLGRCNDPRCIVIYHRTMEDIDRNHYVCPSCRKSFSDSLNYHFGADNLG